MFSMCYLFYNCTDLSVHWSLHQSINQPTAATFNEVKDQRSYSTDSQTGVTGGHIEMTDYPMDSWTSTQVDRWDRRRAGQPEQVDRSTYVVVQQVSLDLGGGGVWPEASHHRDQLRGLDLPFPLTVVQRETLFKLCNNTKTHDQRGLYTHTWSETLHYTGVCLKEHLHHIIPPSTTRPRDQLVNSVEHLTAKEPEFSLRSWWRPKPELKEQRLDSFGNNIMENSDVQSSSRVVTLALSEGRLLTKLLLENLK